jgi:phosphate-selective porin OprO/OprP
MVHRKIQGYKFAVFLGFVLAPLSLFAQDLVIPDSAKPAVKKRDWNEFNAGFTTVRLGFGVIYEQAAYSQDAEGKAQLDSAGVNLESKTMFRDFRLLASGRFNTKRAIIWKFGYMYDGVTQSWTVRETGLQIAMPELSGHIFIGRQKEGYSLNKAQNGYSTWGNERQPSIDLVAIMADGIKYYGYATKPRIFWSVAAFSNFIYGDHSKYMPWKWIYAARAGWRPVYDVINNEILHLGISFRYAKPINDTIQVRSKPESNPAPYFIDGGRFQADKSTGIGAEAYYRKGPIMLATELNFHHFNSEQAGNPTYSGGDFTFTYLFTGETRPYLSDNSAFFFVEPKKPVFKGGFGAWELVLRYSYFNTNAGNVPGGNFWKFNPMVNWYLTKGLRIEFVYGYGVLDRFHVAGATQFFQTRIQYALL